MTLHEAQQQLFFQLQPIYSNGEARQITDLVMEHITGSKRADRLLNKNQLLRTEEVEKLNRVAHDLLQHKPVQYVLKEAWFAGMPLYVDEKVLIPRPETEELVDWIAKDIRRAQNNQGFRIMDIGTGSGCIALGLKRQLPFCEVHACDISEGALAVANRNAEENDLSVQFHLINILAGRKSMGLPVFNCIVSNPPYVPYSDRSLMTPNVVDYEPPLALFVPNNDPLLFYRAILRFAGSNLVKGGSIYLEIHEELAEPVRQLLLKEGYLPIELRKDMQGKDRMVKAILLPG